MLYVGQVQDITERKRAEESLKLFRTLIDHSNDAIEVIDPATGRFLDMNQKGREDLQYSREEILRLSVMDIDPSVAKRGWDKSLEHFRRTDILVLETEHQRKDGSVFPVEINSKLVRMDRDYLVAVVRDITERKKSEEALHESEERFRQAQKMEAVGQLAGGVAHDFNNLLTIISGYSEILFPMLGPDDPKRELVKSISEAGERAASLTRQLLAFSRKTVLEPKVLDLNEVVRDTGKLLRRLIGEDILFTTVLDPTISRVKVDPDQLGQVLMNLAVNARDAMPKGGKLTVETRNVELDREYTRLRPEAMAGQYVLLAMTDTGNGMSTEVKARIFEPFFTTKGVGKGTGLGLAVVLGIVKQSGGHVEVYSELDIGTTFKIYLPVVEEKASDSKLIDIGESGFGTETILVVEDEDGVRGLAVLVLKTYGYKVVAASNGKEAMRLVAKHQGGIDLMVTDVVMPGIGGPDLAEALLPYVPQMKVLFSSGYTDDAVIRHGLLQEKVAFLQKPYSPLALVRKVRQVLDEK
jgi:PAS domain S-box-containing protein